MSKEQIEEFKKQFKSDIGHFKQDLSDQEELMAVYLALFCQFPEATFDTEELTAIHPLIREMDQNQEIKQKIIRAVDYLKQRAGKKYGDGPKQGGISKASTDGAWQNFKGLFKKKGKKESDEEQDQNSQKSENKSKK